MKTEIQLDILAQPDDESCGPTCLHALYKYYGDDVPLKKVITEIQRADYGGTLIEILACHALHRGYDAMIYTYHVQMFDPTWFADDGGLHDPAGVRELLRAQLEVKKNTPRLATATKAYREFLARGGQLKMEDLSTALLSKHIGEGTPIMTGLSSTFLYRERRIVGTSMEDDVRGVPQGHFVMLVGFDSAKREVTIADPLDDNPPFHANRYRLPVARLINAVLLGILTHDANLLVIKPRYGAPEFKGNRRSAHFKKQKQSAGKGPKRKA